MNFEVVVTESAGHTDGGQHPRLENKLVRVFKKIFFKAFSISAGDKSSL